MQGRLLRLVLLVGVPVLALLGAAAFWLTGGRYVTSEHAYVRADIVQIAPEVAGRATEVLVRDHARVTAGQVLVRLDPTPF
ncbi:MAG: biotin/lipoyl-binding protein, partial [Alphaproteobacteria bacterium]